MSEPEVASEGAGRVPAALKRLAEAFSRECPKCGAAVGAACTSVEAHRFGEENAGPHRARLGLEPHWRMKAAMRVSCPSCGAARDAACVSVQGPGAGTVVDEPHSIRSDLKDATFQCLRPVDRPWWPSRVVSPAGSTSERRAEFWRRVAEEQEFYADELAPVWAARERRERGEREGRERGARGGARIAQNKRRQSYSQKFADACEANFREVRSRVERAYKTREVRERRERSFEGLYQRVYVGLPRENRCFYCGVSANGEDHVPSLARVASMEIRERLDAVCLLVPSCWDCNKLLGARGDTVVERAKLVFEEQYWRALDCVRDGVFGHELDTWLDDTQERLRERRIRRVVHAMRVAHGEAVRLECVWPRRGESLAGEPK